MYKVTDENKALARQIIREECYKIKLELSDEVLEEKVNEILNISYSIGGGYDKNTLRKIIKSMLKRENL